MAVPLRDASALGGNVKPARSMRRLKAAKNLLSESIGSRTPELDSSLKAALSSLGTSCVVPSYMESNHVQSISVKKKAKQQPASETLVKQDVKPTTQPKAKKPPKVKAKKQKVVTSQPPAEAKPVQTTADVAELSYHLAQGDARGAKSYLEYHFNGDKAAEKEWVAANSAELLEASLSYEPTNYSPDGDPDPKGHVFYDNTPVSVELSTPPIENWVRREDKLHFSGKRKAKLTQVRPRAYDNWLERNTPITRKNGSPVVTWLADKEVCAMQAVTDVEPVMVGNLQLGRALVRRVVEVPQAVSVDVVVEHVKRRVGGYRAAYGDSYVPNDNDLAIIKQESKPVVVKQPIAANDAEPPPWEEPVKAATFYDDIQRQRSIHSYNYENFKWRWFFENVHKDLRQTKNERIRNVFNTSMSQAIVSAETTPKPAEYNLQDDVIEAVPGNMDGSVVYVDSEEELQVMESLRDEFAALSFWERGELKVKAEDAGTTVDALLDQQIEDRLDILRFKQELNKGYSLLARKNNVATAALELQRYDTWFRWATEADTPQYYARNDMQRYHEHWDNLWYAKPWEYQYALDRVALQEHLQLMENIRPSVTWVRDPIEHTPSPVGKAGAKAASESVTPDKQSHTNLNEPDDPQKKEESVIRQILEADKSEVGFELRGFVEALKGPVVDINLVRNYIQCFQPTEGGVILVPS